MKLFLCVLCGESFSLFLSVSASLSEDYVFQCLRRERAGGGVKTWNPMTLSALGSLPRRGRDGDEVKRSRPPKKRGAESPEELRAFRGRGSVRAGAKRRSVTLYERGGARREEQESR